MKWLLCFCSIIHIIIIPHTAMNPYPIICLYICMSVTLQEHTFAFPYVPICRPLSKWLPTIRSHGLLLQFHANSIIASCKLASRAPYLWRWTVWLMDCAVWSRKVSLERFASITAIAMVGVASFGLSNLCKVCIVLAITHNTPIAS